jgi:hypothetical protein
MLDSAETVAKMPADIPQITVSSNGRRRGKLRLINRKQIDGRTKAARTFDAIASGIVEDLGGSDRLSTVQKHLVEAFAGVALAVHDVNARLLLGEEIDIVEQSQAVSTMVRVAQRIGLRRVARDISPSLSEYLEADEVAI